MSDFDRQPDLTVPARGQRQILTEVGSLRDAVSVLTSVVMRQDGALTALLTGLRASHARHGRLANRVRALGAGSTAAG